MSDRCSARRLGVMLALFAGAASAHAQWNPQNAQYRKTDPRDIRIMTWNIKDRICSSGPKVDGINGWTAQSRLVAAMRPDVLILQETGDNSGNGTGSGVDSVVNLTTTLQLFLNGGTDPFRGGAVTAYVKKWAPDYDLPYIYVNTISDNFNRNVLLSRFPLTDINGGSGAVIPDATMAQDLYNVGGGLAIRGFMFAELDLPNDQYRGNLVVGGGHLKSGGTTTDFTQRLSSGKNIAYFIDYQLNGAGGSIPDPRNKIFMPLPEPTSTLDAFTPVIWMGDMNEDENTNGRDGPVQWMVSAPTIGGGTDGTDRDRTDSSFDDSRDVWNAALRQTFGSTSKLDYILWQDSIATLRRSFIFNGGSVPAGKFPPEIVGYGGNFENIINSTASDHLPVIADFILPAPSAPAAFTLTAPADGAVDVPLEPTLTWAAAADATSYSVTIATDASLTNIVTSVSGLTAPSYIVPAGVLQNCQTYFWGATAFNAFGSTASTPSTFTFASERPADVNNDGETDFGDFLEFFNCFDNELPCADIDGNEGSDFGDFLFFFNGFDVGC